MLMLVCGAFLAMGQAGPSDDEASPESIVLRDAAGRKRLFLGVTENGAAVVRLRAASSKAAAMLRMSADGVFSFECGDMKGSLRAMLQVRSHGPTVFRLLDHTQRYESRMTVDSRGSTLKLGRRESRAGVLLQGGQRAQRPVVGQVSVRVPDVRRAADSGKCPVPVGGAVRTGFRTPPRTSGSTID